MSVFDASCLPENASFRFYEKMGICDNQYYLYAPSRPNMTFGMSPMLNSLLFLYTDKPVKNLDEAWEVFQKSGLQTLAEGQAVFVAIPVPLNGNSWTKADYNGYYNIQYVLSGGNIEFHGPGTAPILQYTRYVYNNKQFVIGEGSGASFINNVLSQNCNRIAGACTFGGTMESGLAGTMPLPAFLVSPCDTALAYYRKVNEVDTVSNREEYQAGYPLKKIVLAEGGSSFDAALIRRAWDEIFSRTARVCVDDNIVCSNLSAKTWILQDWPNYAELGIRTKEHYVDDYVCYDLLPAGIQADCPAPLVITCHGGGDDCLYHVNSCGWVTKCAEENFILITPDFPNGAPGGTTPMSSDDYADFIPIADHIRKVLDYALETYNVDRTRIYIAGFSMGSSVSSATALRNLDKFAACCVMGGMGYTSPWYEHHVSVFKYKYDMPACIVSGDEDVMSLDVDYNGNPALFGVHSGGLPINGLDRLMEINKLPYGCADYGKYGMWGYPVDQTVTREDKGLKYHVGSIYRDDREAPLVQLVTFEGAGHAHSSFFGTLCWDFMSQFIRLPNGVVKVVKNNYPK